MKATITIEDYANGIALKGSSDAENSTPTAIVALEHDKEKAIGKTIAEDIRQVMDSEICNAVRMRIEYEPIKSEP